MSFMNEIWLIVFTLQLSMQIKFWSKSFNNRGRSGFGDSVLDSVSRPDSMEEPPYKWTCYVKPVESQMFYPCCDTEVWRGSCRFRCHPRHVAIVQNYKMHTKKAVV
ncbi:hypothetical protein AVEN_28956-1 [Araneus ventricosus]|uniref:Uncharacterized protein n=1 Tax=Araneus ventricosus TaxID=182803 RepID=A0A4Y2AL15_ARAVE|nr:hypothetical protein AVEN_28956-1 [Araneus ventricosus]